MTSKHTPGPWEFVLGGTGDYPTWNVRIGPSVTALNSGFPMEEMDANAHLIAAAPEMLGALKGLEEAYCRAGDSLSQTERIEDRKRLWFARSAIAKATGQ